MTDRTVIVKQPEQKKPAVLIPVGLTLPVALSIFLGGAGVGAAGGGLAGYGAAAAQTDIVVSVAKQHISELKDKYDRSLTIANQLMNALKDANEQIAEAGLHEVCPPQKAVEVVKEVVKKVAVEACHWSPRPLNMPE